MNIISSNEYVRTIRGEIGIFEKYSSRKETSIYKSNFDHFIILQGRKTHLQCDKSYIVNKIGYDNLLKIGKLANKYMKVSYFIEHKYFYYMKPESLENDEKEELIGEMKKVLKNIKRS